MKNFLVDSGFVRDSVLAMRPPQGLTATAKRVGVSAGTLYRCMWTPPVRVSQRTAARLVQAFGKAAVVVETDEPP